jgi:hypothetical protein
MLGGAASSCFLNLIARWCRGNSPVRFPHFILISCTANNIPPFIHYQEFRKITQMPAYIEPICVSIRAQNAKILGYRIVMIITFSIAVNIYSIRILKNAVFWNMTPCGCCKNRCFGGTYRLRDQGEKNQ